MAKVNVTLKLEESLAELLTDERTRDAVTLVLTKMLQRETRKIDLEVALNGVEADMLGKGLSQHEVDSELAPVRKLVRTVDLRRRAYRILGYDR